MQNKLKIALVASLVIILSGLGLYWVVIRFDQNGSIEDKAYNKQKNFVEEVDDRETPENFQQERDVVVDTAELKRRLQTLLERQDWRVVETSYGSGMNEEDESTFILHGGKVVRRDNNRQIDLVKSGTYYMVTKGRYLWSGNPDDFSPETLYYKKRVISDEISAHIDYVMNYRFLPSQVLGRVEWIEKVNDTRKTMSALSSDTAIGYVGWKQVRPNNFIFQFEERDGKYERPGGSEGSFDVRFEREKGDNPQITLTFATPPNAEGTDRVVLDFSPVVDLEETLRFPKEAVETFQSVAGFRD